MVTLEWTQRIVGTAVYCHDQFVLTAPALGDGNWRGGYWGRYRRCDGAFQWQRFHRRGCSFFDLVDDVILATTHKYSGIYALSLRDGRMLWTRMGDRFEWLFRVFEWLPCDNEADTPLATIGNQLLTHRGLLLESKSGRTVRRCQFQYAERAPGDTSFGQQLVSVDGEPFHPFMPPNRRFDFPDDPGARNRIADRLNEQGLVRGRDSLVVRFGDWLVVLAEEVWKRRAGLSWPIRPRYPDSRDDEVPHFLVLMDRNASRVELQIDLGTYYSGHIAWVDSSTVAIACQTRRQRMWSSQRFLKMFRWTTLP